MSAAGASRCKKNACGRRSLAVGLTRTLKPVNPQSLTLIGYTHLEMWETGHGRRRGTRALKRAACNFYPPAL